MNTDLEKLPTPTDGTAELTLPPLITEIKR